MSIQYLSDENGHVIAVQVPIEEWKEIKRMYPDAGAPAYELPDWQKQLIGNL